MLAGQIRQTHLLPAREDHGNKSDVDASIPAKIDGSE